MPHTPFPITKTKTEGVTETFRLDDPVERKKYFERKAGREIELLRDYLRENSFIGFLLGPKNSGKGTYSKLFAEAVGAEYIRHISVGDIVRSVHKDFEDETRKKELLAYLETAYRGTMPLGDALDAFLGRSTATLLPTEFILALVEREITKLGRKAIFLDGFPRSPDQISYSLYFRALMGYRNDPDFFVFIDVPETIINERMKERVICPVCQTPRSMKLLKTKEVGHDEKTGEFYLMCDTPGCKKARYVGKEGDELGIEAIRDRIEADKTIMNTLLGMEGIPKIYLRNAIPVADASSFVDAYELTPSYRYEYDAGAKQVSVHAEPWIVPDDEGTPSYSLLPSAIVLSLIRQAVDVLGLGK